MGGSAGTVSGAPPPPPSAKEITVQGETFRRNLASWTDHQEQRREEQRFVELVYNFDGNCNLCHRAGHRQIGCPTLFDLDPRTGKDLNPKSYFYTLRPPPVALEAGKLPGGSRQGGGLRGGRGGGSINRNPRGSVEPSALAAVLEATARLETRLELMSREQQRDHDRVEQVAQQMGEQLGNERAGAAQ